MFHILSLRRKLKKNKLNSTPFYNCSKKKIKKIMQRIKRFKESS